MSLIDPRLYGEQTAPSSLALWSELPVSRGPAQLLAGSREDTLAHATHTPLYAPPPEPWEGSVVTLWWWDAMREMGE